MMTKKQKIDKGQEVISLFANNKAIFVVDCDRFNAGKTQAFRKKLSGVEGRMMIVKNTVLKIAAENSSSARMKQLSTHFNKQVALIFAKENVSGVASLMKDFGFGKEIFVRGGAFDEFVFGKEKFDFFSSIPSVSVLHARLCGVLKFGTVGRLVNVMHQIATKTN